MAGISAIQRMLDNQLTSRFARSLKHSDLPEGWADNPEIVELAADAYREMGTESPFFKAWFGGGNVVDEAGNPGVITHATQGATDYKPTGEYDKYGIEKIEVDILPPFEEFKGKHGGIYTLPPDAKYVGDYLDTLGGSAPYQYDLFTNSKMVDLTSPPKGKKTKVEKAINSLFSRQEKKDIGEASGGGYWNPVQSFYDGELWNDADRATQDTVIEKLRRELGADAIKYNDNPSPGWDAQSLVVFDPKRLKSTSNRGTFNPDDPNIYRGLISAVGAGGLLSMLGAEEAEAAPAVKAMIPLVAGGAVLTPDEAQGSAYQFPVDKRGTVLYEPGLESPIVDPADLLAAPIGVPTAALKAASVAVEPFVAYGMDKLIGGMLSLFDEEE